MIFVTLMLPLEVRIVPTYAVAANALAPFQAILDWTGITWLIQTVSGIRVKLEWGLLNSYPGLILPLVATATGTFLYRQFYLTVPDELAEAAKMDGSGPVRFFRTCSLLLVAAEHDRALHHHVRSGPGTSIFWPLLVTTDPEIRHRRHAAQDADPLGIRPAGLERRHGRHR